MSNFCSYVREFLNGCASGGIIHIDDQGMKYFLPKDRLAILSSCQHNSPLMPMLQIMPMTAPVFQDLLECFKLSGPKGLLKL